MAVMFRPLGRWVELDVKRLIVILAVHLVVPVGSFRMLAVRLGKMVVAAAGIWAALAGCPVALVDSSMAVEEAAAPQFLVLGALVVTGLCLAQEAMLLDMGLVAVAVVRLLGEPFKPEPQAAQGRLAIVRCSGLRRRDA